MWFVSHRYALAYNQRHGRINHLLGRRFHSSEVPDTHAARAVCVYIALNPVRAGLCAHPLDWEFGSYRSHAAGEQMPRAHIQPDLTRELFVAAGPRSPPRRRPHSHSTAVDARRWPRRTPSCRYALPTPAHILHARELYGYTVPEIATHHRRPARALTLLAR